MTAVGGLDASLLERESELAGASAALERARAGDGGVLAIVGSAGIGKTRLLAALRGFAARLGVTTLFARGSELERDFAFGVVRQLFEARVARAQAGERRELLAGAAGLATGLVSPGEPAVASARSSDLSIAALHGLYWLTVNLAERGPLLVVVDDAHWADPDSLRYLAYLVPRLEHVPVLVALSARPAEPGAEQPLLDALLADSLVNVLELRPLTGTAVASLVRTRLGESVQEVFCEACHAATGGNPFLLSELLLAVQQEQIEPSAAAAPLLLRLGPGSVRRAVLARLGRLGGEARVLAAAVAVLGGRAPLRLAAAVAELSETGATEAADDLARLEILRDARPLEFVHPLVRTAVYLDLPAQRRSNAHDRAARLLRDADASADEVAAHLMAVDPRGDRQVVDVLMDAASLAMRCGARESAARYMRRALEEPPPPELLASVLLELGVVLGAGYEHEECVRTLKRAVATSGSDRQRAQAALRAARVMSSSASHREAIEFCIAGTASQKRADSETLLRLEAELVLNARMVASTVALALERLEHLAAIAPPGSTGEALVLPMRAFVNTLAGHPAAPSGQDVEGALREGVLDEHDSAMAKAVAFVPSWNEQLDLATTISNAYINWAREQGSRIALSAFVQSRSIAELRAGAIADAVADASEAHEICRELGIPGRWPIATLTDALIARGDLDAAERAHAGFRGELPKHFTSALLIQSRGRLRCVQGRLHEGLADLREAGRRWRDLRVEHPGLAYWREDAAIALAALGQQDEASELAAEQLTAARCVGARGLVGSALRTQGLAAGGETGIELLCQAVATLERSPTRLVHAHALVDLGASIRRAGYRKDARAPLGEGLALARRCGALALAERAYHELQATGAHPRKILRTGVDALTPSEHRVARLAAGGMTNKEIAQALFVTVRTVETHLHSAYRKLDITTRAELSNALGGG